jgi:hypothetical protein
MAETRKLLYFSTVDRRKTCPYPRIVRTTVSADRTSASTLSRRRRRLIPRVSAWSKDESFWSRELAPNLVCGGSRGEYCRARIVISWVHPYVHWAIARTLTRTAEA